MGLSAQHCRAPSELSLDQGSIYIRMPRMRFLPSIGLPHAQKLLFSDICSLWITHTPGLKPRRHVKMMQGLQSHDMDTCNSVLCGCYASHHDCECPPSTSLLSPPEPNWPSTPPQSGTLCSPHNLQTRLRATSGPYHIINVMQWAKFYQPYIARCSQGRRPGRTRSGTEHISIDQEATVMTSLWKI